MTTNLFAIAKVKQLRTYLVLEFYCLFFRTSWCVGVLNSAIFFNSFHNRVAFVTIFWRAFGISRGGLNTRTPPGYATAVWGSNLGRGEIFRTCPDRPWGPPSLLYNGYRVFPGVKSGRGLRLNPHPF